MAWRRSVLAAVSKRRPRGSPRAAIAAASLGVFLSLVPAASAQQAHIEKWTGNAHAGKELFRRFCIGCHGKDGDGNGENAPYVDPKPRDFTLGIYKCRSPPARGHPPPGRVVCFSSR